MREHTVKSIVDTFTSFRAQLSRASETFAEFRWINRDKMKHVNLFLKMWCDYYTTYWFDAKLFPESCHFHFCEWNNDSRKSFVFHLISCARNDVNRICRRCFLPYVPAHSSSSNTYVFWRVGLIQKSQLISRSSNYHFLNVTIFGWTPPTPRRLPCNMTWDGVLAKMEGDFYTPISHYSQPLYDFSLVLFYRNLKRVAVSSWYYHISLIPPERDHYCI